MSDYSDVKAAAILMLHNNPRIGLGWRATWRMGQLVWNDRRKRGDTRETAPTVAEFVEICENNDLQYTDLLGGRFTDGKTIAGKGTAAQIISFMARIGHPFPWMAGAQEWVEGHTLLGQTGINTAPMSAHRLDRLRTIRKNISRLESEIEAQRALHAELLDKMRGELDEERTALDRDAGMPHDV